MQKDTKIVLAATFLFVVWLFVVGISAMGAIAFIIAYPLIVYLYINRAKIPLINMILVFLKPNKRKILVVVILGMIVYANQTCQFF